MPSRSDHYIRLSKSRKNDPSRYTVSSIILQKILCRESFFFKKVTRHKLRERKESRLMERAICQAGVNADATFFHIMRGEKVVFENLEAEKFFVCSARRRS